MFGKYTFISKGKVAVRDTKGKGCVDVLFCCVVASCGATQAGLPLINVKDNILLGRSFCFSRMYNMCMKSRVSIGRRPQDFGNVCVAESRRMYGMCMKPMSLCLFLRAPPKSSCQYVYSSRVKTQRVMLCLAGAGVAADVQESGGEGQRR